MTTRVILFCAAAALAAGAGCKSKKGYSADCKRGVSLTAPWSELALPTGDGRVCSSDAKQAKVQYLTKHEADWEAAYDQALVAAGFTKDKCTDLSCTYKRGDEKVTVQGFEGKMWNSITIRR